VFGAIVEVSLQCETVVAAHPCSPRVLLPRATASRPQPALSEACVSAVCPFVVPAGNHSRLQRVGLYLSVVQLAEIRRLTSPLEVICIRILHVFT
jgi:hypothetical protein